MDKTDGFGCLGHSNWTICSLLSQFCSHNFPTFSLSCWEANSYYPRGLILRKGNSHNSWNEWERGISVAGEFKRRSVRLHVWVSIFIFLELSHFWTVANPIRGGRRNASVCRADGIIIQILALKFDPVERFSVAKAMEETHSFIHKNWKFHVGSVVDHMRDHCRGEQAKRGNKRGIWWLGNKGRSPPTVPCPVQQGNLGVMTSAADDDGKLAKHDKPILVTWTFKQH